MNSISNLQMLQDSYVTLFVVYSYLKTRKGIISMLLHTFILLHLGKNVKF